MRRKPYIRKHNRNTILANLATPALVCLLSGLGSWAGIMLTAWYTSTATTHQTTFEWESKVLDRRVEIIEK